VEGGVLRGTGSPPAGVGPAEGTWSGLGWGGGVGLGLGGGVG